MGNRQDFLIKALVEICQKLDNKGFGANHDGNVSVKYEDTLLTTPTAVSKGDIVPEMILTLDMEGKKIRGVGNPFSEIKLHLAAYRAGDSINAVVHAHPPFSMARGLAGGDFEVGVPEAVVSIGDVIPVAPYAFPGAPENNGIIAEALSKCDVFLMAGNGVLAVGRDLKEAYLRMELLEHLLKIDYYARSMPAANPMTLPTTDKQKLLEKRASIGLGPRGNYSPTTQHSSPSQTDLMKKLIAEELTKILKKA
ncbi:MAG: class II aldolase/adducin family protein [bacterium]|nr:class II aldolase/adducin family protein [bacterium]